MLFSQKHPLSAKLKRVLEILGAIFFLLTLGATLLGIGARYFHVKNVDWSFEVAALSFVWVIFIGCALSEIEKENVSFTGLTSNLPDRFKPVIEGISNLVLLLCSVWLTISGFFVLSRSAWVPTPVLRLPNGVVLFALFSAAIILALIAIVRLAHLIQNKNSAPEKTA